MIVTKPLRTGSLPYRAEMKSAMEEAGFPCEMIVYRKYSGDLVPMNEYWRRFPEKELRIEVAFFVNSPKLKSAVT